MENTIKQIFLAIIFSGQLAANSITIEENDTPYTALIPYCAESGHYLQGDCYSSNISPDGLWYLTVDKSYVDFLHGGNSPFDDIVDPTYDLYIHKWDESVVIKYHNNDGLIIDYGNPFWSPENDRFYMYGYDELYLFILDEENESVRLISYPHIAGVDRSSRKTKSMYNFAGSSYDGFYMFDSGPNWLYDGRLVNYMSGKGNYAVYEEDGNISELSFNIKGDYGNDLTEIEIDDYKSDDGIYTLHGRKQYQDVTGEWHKQSCVGVVQFTVDTADAMISHCLPMDSSAYIYPFLATADSLYYEVVLKNSTGNYFGSVFQYNYETGKKKAVYGPFFSSETTLCSSGFYFFEKDQTEKVWLYDPRFGIVRLLFETRLWEKELPDEIADEYLLSILRNGTPDEEIILNGRYIFLSNKNYELTALYDVFNREMVALSGEHIIFMNDYLTWNKEVNGWFFRQKDEEGNYMEELVLIQPEELFGNIN